MQPPEIQGDLLLQILQVKLHCLWLGKHLTHSPGSGPRGFICLNQFLNLAFYFLRQFVAIWPKHLDAIVLQGVVRCRNDDAACTTQGLSEKSDCRGGDYSNKHCIKPG